MADLGAGNVYISKHERHLMVQLLKLRFKDDTSGISGKQMKKKLKRGGLGALFKKTNKQTFLTNMFAAFVLRGPIGLLFASK